MNQLAYKIVIFLMIHENVASLYYYRKISDKNYDVYYGPRLIWGYKEFTPPKSLKTSFDDRGERPGACENGEFLCQEPSYPTSETGAFECRVDYQCPRYFKCCQPNCFQHKICQPYVETEKAEENSNEISKEESTKFSPVSSVTITSLKPASAIPTAGTIYDDEDLSFSGDGAPTEEVPVTTGRGKSAEDLSFSADNDESKTTTTLEVTTEAFEVTTEPNNMQTTSEADENLSTLEPLKRSTKSSTIKLFTTNTVNAKSTATLSNEITDDEDLMFSGDGEPAPENLVINKTKTTSTKLTDKATATPFRETTKTRRPTLILTTTFKPPKEPSTTEYGRSLSYSEEDVISIEEGEKTSTKIREETTPSTTRNENDLVDDEDLFQGSGDGGITATSSKPKQASSTSSYYMFSTVPTTLIEKATSVADTAMKINESISLPAVTKESNTGDNVPLTGSESGGLFTEIELTTVTQAKEKTEISTISKITATTATNVPADEDAINIDEHEKTNTKVREEATTVSSNTLNEDDTDDEYLFPGSGDGGVTETLQTVTKKAEPVVDIIKDANVENNKSTFPSTVTKEATTDERETTYTKQKTQASTENSKLLTNTTSGGKSLSYSGENVVSTEEIEVTTEKASEEDTAASVMTDLISSSVKITKTDDENLYADSGHASTVQTSPKQKQVSSTPIDDLLLTLPTVITEPTGDVVTETNEVIAVSNEKSIGDSDKVSIISGEREKMYTDDTILTVLPETNDKSITSSVPPLIHTTSLKFSTEPIEKTTTGVDIMQNVGKEWIDKVNTIDDEDYAERSGDENVFSGSGSGEAPVEN